MTEVSFTQRKNGTQADYEFLEQLENDHISGLPDRIMKALAGLSEGLAGYKIACNTRFRLRLARRMRAPVSIGLWPPWYTILVMSWRH